MSSIFQWTPLVSLFRQSQPQITVRCRIVVSSEGPLYTIPFEADWHEVPHTRVTDGDCLGWIVESQVSIKCIPELTGNCWILSEGQAVHLGIPAMAS